MIISFANVAAVYKIYTGERTREIYVQRNTEVRLNSATQTLLR